MRLVLDYRTLKKNNRGYPTREAEDAQLLSAKKYMQDRIRELKNKSG
jgi:hypothetical protein